MRFGWSCSAKSFIETKIFHFASLFLTQDTLFHYLDPCCKIPDISFADIFSIYIFLLIRSSVDDDDDESEYIYSAQYTVPWVPQTFLARFRFPVIVIPRGLRKFPPHARKTSGTQGKYTETPSTCIRTFLNLHLFSGFKNFHVYTYPFSNRICPSTRIRHVSVFTLVPRTPLGILANRAGVVKRLKFASCSTLCYICFSILSLELWQHPLGNQTKMQRVRKKQLS